MNGSGVITYALTGARSLSPTSIAWMSCNNLQLKVAILPVSHTRDWQTTMQQITVLVEARSDRNRFAAFFEIAKKVANLKRTALAVVAQAIREMSWHVPHQHLLGHVVVVEVQPELKVTTEANATLQMPV